ncbi:MAG: HAD-IIB family hydrolase [Oscillospiraceae bacterium]|nr:HAD-IIB family hydrolase [Oscillospiraceae bacterium]
MALFDDILLTVDHDRTLTGPDSKIPARNLEAIRYFTENGGSFTLNTGRSTTTMRDLFHIIPVNAPFLLYNGSATWENGVLTPLQLIDLPLWETLDAVQQAFPEMNLEIQGVDNHYLIDPREEFIGLYNKMHWGWAPAVHGADHGPFIKFAAYGPVRNVAYSDMFDCSDADEARFQEMTDFILSRWGDKVDVFRAAPRIMDVQAKGVSKGAAARTLQARLGKKILVCVGDAHNDISMLNEADYAFCPADGVVADRYKTVCKCADGAVADVIYEKIPEILRNLP